MHKVWLYAPGENASKWDVCLSQNIMCIGWDEMGVSGFSWLVSFLLSV